MADSKSSGAGPEPDSSGDSGARGWDPLEADGPGAERASAAGEGARDRVEELAHSLLENPVVSQAIGAAFGARNRALNAQRLAMEALDVPSAGDLERLERRLRMLSERVEELESELDRALAELRQARHDAKSTGDTGSGGGSRKATGGKSKGGGKSGSGDSGGGRASGSR